MRYAGRKEIKESYTLADLVVLDKVVQEMVDDKDYFRVVNLRSLSLNTIYYAPIAASNVETKKK